MTLVMGAVAYDPKVVTIWGGFRAWLGRTVCRSTSSCTGTTSARSKISSKAASTLRGIHRWPGSAPRAWRRHGAGRSTRWSCATLIVI